jgi:hypothetical protein
MGTSVFEVYLHNKLRQKCLDNTAGSSSLFRKHLRRFGNSNQIQCPRNSSNMSHRQCQRLHLNYLAYIQEDRYPNLVYYNSYWHKLRGQLSHCLSYHEYHAMCIGMD